MRILPECPNFKPSGFYRFYIMAYKSILLFQVFFVDFKQQRPIELEGNSI
jgi:hypothetical protein